MVKPITRSETFNFLAKLLAPSIKNSEPKYKPKDPKIKKNKLDSINTVHFHL